MGKLRRNAQSKRQCFFSFFELSQLFAEKVVRYSEQPALPAPRAMRYALCALAPFWLLLIYQLGAQWMIYQQYNYGWAVPFLCAYFIWLRVQSSEFKVQA